MSSSPVIGIDLGTTFTCAAIYRNGRAELIPNTEGDRLTPSIVYYRPQSGKAEVGKTAYDLIPQFPKNGLLGAKRFIGRKFDDEFVSRYIKSNQTHFDLVQAPDGQAAFQIEVSDKLIMKKPEEVSSEILNYIKQTAEVYIGESVTRAVITVPAYFSNAQRKATKKAAELAGLSVLKLITEPTAAAIHYVSTKNRKDSNILVFDFGGGTLDVSLIKVHCNTFEVKAVYGDTLLGGRYFDDILFEHFFNDFQSMRNGSFNNIKFKRRLSNICVNLKNKLSTNEEFTYYIDLYDGNTDLSVSITREKFETLSKDIFSRIMRVLELCLDDSRMKKSDIREVVLVGGSTRIPRIKNMLSSYFGGEKIQTDLNPDEAVAAGASIHAAFLVGDCKDLEKYKVTEVTPMSLGTNGSHDLMEFLIPKNSPLPIKVSHLFVTVCNDQTSMLFTVYEGERKNYKYNNRLGEFEITDLPKKRAGDVEFEVCFDLDQDGILNVTATESSTGKTNNLVVTMGEFRLSEKRIKETVEDARRHKAEDDVFEQFVICKRKHQRFCLHVIYAVNKIRLEKDQALVKNMSEEFLKESDDLHYTEIDKLERMFSSYEKSLRAVVKDVTIFK